MNRTVIRITSACLAVIATLSVLQGITSLAAVESAAPTSLAVLPKIEVVMTTHDEKANVVATEIDTNPLSPPL